MSKNMMAMTVICSNVLSLLLVNAVRSQSWKKTLQFGNDNFDDHNDGYNYDDDDYYYYVCYTR